MYQNNRETYKKLYTECPHRWWKKDLGDLEYLELINKHCGNKKIRVIELGCGNGRCLGAIYQPNMELIGVDFSEEGLIMAKSRNLNPAIKLINKDIRDTGFEDKSFDVVLSIGVHEHLNPIDFSEPRRIIKDDGIFICVLPDGASSPGWIKGNPWEYHHSLTKEDWMIHLEKANFEVKYIKRWLFVCYPKKGVTNATDSTSKT